MGDFFQIIVDAQVSIEEAKQLASSVSQWLIGRRVIEAITKDCVLSETGIGYPPGPGYREVVDYDGFDVDDLSVNGLNIVVGRTVFTPGQGNLEKICPQCKMRTVCDDKWFDAVSQWYQNGESSSLQCLNCGCVAPLAGWDTYPKWGFGNLGFVFWNWAPLKKNFVDEFAIRLGHRITFMANKL